MKAAKENGTNVPHENLSQEIVVQQPGYAYIYFSNDNGQPLEVFFDDFTVTHSHSAIVQADDYYPFGLSFNSYKRENSVKNNWKFQGQEHIEDMGLNWISFKWRNHDPAIGRFFNVDPLAESYVHNSPYAFSENKVISHIELEGLEAIDAQAAFKKALVSDKVQNKVSQTNASSRNMFKAEVGVHGAGLGGSVKLGSAGTLGGSAKLAKVDGSITNSGGVNVEGSLVHLEGEATIAGVGGEAELGLGNGSFGMQNGELIGDASLADVSANGVGGNASLDTSGEFGVGIVLGNIAAEVSVSLDAMGEFIKGTVDIIGAVVGEMVNSVMNPVEQIPTEKIDLQY